MEIHACSLLLSVIITKHHLLHAKIWQNKHIKIFTGVIGVIKVKKTGLFFVNNFEYAIFDVKSKNCKQYMKIQKGQIYRATHDVFGL